MPRVRSQKSEARSKQPGTSRKAGARRASRAPAVSWTTQAKATPLADVRAFKAKMEMVGQGAREKTPPEAFLNRPGMAAVARRAAEVPSPPATPASLQQPRGRMRLAREKNVGSAAHAGASHAADPLVVLENIIANLQPLSHEQRTEAIRLVCNALNLNSKGAEPSRPRAED